MDLHDIQSRNYTATVNRGLIRENTSMNDFERKLAEEVLEAMKADNMDELAKELADVIIVCLNYAEHFGIHIHAALEEKTIYNEQRKD